MKMLPPTVIVPERRRGPGRPSLSNGQEPPADVHVTLPPEDYDRAFQIAKRERTSVQDVIRKALKRLFHEERG